MLHKKRKPSTFTSSSGRNVAAKNNMLHSKSTYFYRWLSNLGVAGRSYNSTNGIRCPSPHCEQSGIASDTARAILTRDSRETMPYSRIASYAGFPDGKESRLTRSSWATNSCSKITGRTGTHLVPTTCGLALLLGLGIILNPAINNVEEAFAETVTANPTDYSSISLTISHSNTDGSSTELNTGDTISTNVEPGLISYITNNLRIDTKKINRFYVSIQAAEDGSSELTGTNNHATIAPVGSNKIPTATDENGFGDNTWGFALGEVNAANESMSYNSLPAYGTSTTPQYSSATNLADGTYNLKLTFAAKINADKPSDHYTTKAMVSVAADVKLVGFINEATGVPITTMQEMTTGICANAPDGYSVQLVDDRTKSGLGRTKYWVTKLKDDKCWMTQNLDLPLTISTVLTSADTNVKDASGKYAVSSLDGDYKDPGMVIYKSSAASESLPASNDVNCGDPATSGCSDYFEVYNGKIDGDTVAHYLVGDYYAYDVATVGKVMDDAGSICPKGWRLPTRTEYDTLKVGLDTDSIRRDPYYFVPSGRYCDDNFDHGVGSASYYWSSTVNGSYNAYHLYFYSTRLGTTGSSHHIGYSVRCVAE